MDKKMHIKTLAYISFSFSYIGQTQSIYDRLQWSECTM